MSETKGDEKQQSLREKRLCDFCGESVALLYCRADAAKLCFACDREVHSTNQLFTKHVRSLLCDACDSSPASIYCSTDASVHCQNCDWERHNLLTSTIHDRRPLEGFTGCPSVTELLGIFGFEDVDKKALLVGDGCDGFVGSGDYGSLCTIDGFSDLLVWDTPSFVSLDDLIGSNDSGHKLQAMGVPPLPKNRNAACGQHKEEILHQLHGMSMLEPNFDNGQEGIKTVVGIQDSLAERSLHLRDTCAGFQHGAEQAFVPSYEGNAFPWCSNSGESAEQCFPSTVLEFEKKYWVPDKDSDIGDSSSHAIVDYGGESHCLVITEAEKTTPNAVLRELTSQERDSAISRYKEKKKNRRYDKRIRYESRKARAESRIRIRGRFAKLDQNNTGLC